ncbi:hypothetical protein [Curtobacterium sp. MCBD17_021]|uniref:hypothetical protein n=1 Tax=Curtobacterium sp. MCBD17_021 TaxID=2175665 RepID=UPI000DA86435|nr:hypothetical protein [Curtobacterium sp. MCBD17_021]PZE66888.1 hypothetical protein DEI83_06150 [Curtobacterium sp. MCBD17_021]
MWTHWICSTKTGEKLAPVEATSSQFSRKLNGVGTGTHEFVTASLGAGSSTAERRTSRLDLLRTWDRTIVQCWNDKPMYAGVIVGKGTKTDGTVSVRTVDVREILKYRTTFGQNGYNGREDGRFILQNKTLTLLAAYLLWDVTQGLTDNWDLPLLLPSREGTGTQDRVYHEFNLPVIETELAAIQNTEGGPDIDFDPVWYGVQLRWQVRVGDLSGGPFDFNMTASKPQATDFVFDEDGNAQGNVFYAVGNGQDRDLKVATSTTLLGPDQVALERIVSYGQERSQTVLQAHANEDLRTSRKATRQFSFDIQADGRPGAGNLSLGQTLRTYVEDHDWLPDGWMNHRLIGFSGDLTTTIKLQLQEQ